MAIFPLAQVTLMPHAVLPIHIFEPRYRQMIDDALDGPGQIAMAVIDPQSWIDDEPEARGAGGGGGGRADSGLDPDPEILFESDDENEDKSDGDDASRGGRPSAGEEGDDDIDALIRDAAGDDAEVHSVNSGSTYSNPLLRPAVCVGQIVQHQKLDDGRYNIAVHGVCRAKIIHELDRPKGQLYRVALLEPVGINNIDERRLEGARRQLHEIMASTALKDMTDAKAVVKHLSDPEVPTSAILELVSFSILSGSELRYRLLAEGDAFRRAALIEGELSVLRRLLELAAPQRQSGAPKGCNWN